MKKILISIMCMFVVIISMPFLFLKNNENINAVNKDVDIVKEKSIDLPSVVTVYVTQDKKQEEFSLEDYVKGVVAAEMPAAFDTEALKAQAIAARTLAVANYIKNNGKTNLDNTIAYQAFDTKDEAMKKWSASEADIYWKKINDAVDSTNGMILFYNNKIMEDVKYFATSSGNTENSEDVFGTNEPYLKSVKSPGEEIAPKFKTTSEFKIDDFISKINTYFKINLKKENLESQIKIEKRTEAGTVTEIKLNGKSVSGVNFRKCLSLNSANFTFEFKKDTIKVNCIGYGHDVGMSQWGANVMAKEGNSYADILTHYYSGINIKKIE